MHVHEKEVEPPWMIIAVVAVTGLAAAAANARVFLERKSAKLAMQSSAYGQLHWTILLPVQGPAQGDCHLIRWILSSRSPIRGMAALRASLSSGRTMLRGEGNQAGCCLSWNNDINSASSTLLLFYFNFPPYFFLN